jgi:hypothetical protein
MNAKAQLVIIWREDGKVQTSGCIGSEPIALWLLEKAKDSIKEYNKKLGEEPRVTPVASLEGIVGNGR